MRTMRGEGLETETLSIYESGAEAHEAGAEASETTLMQRLDESLHAMSQPMTVLLCALEYSAGLNSVEEMRQMIRTSQESCERLRASVLAMQARLREASEAGHVLLK